MGPLFSSSSHPRRLARRAHGVETLEPRRLLSGEGVETPLADPVIEVPPPDLAFFTPAGWPAPVVLSGETGTHAPSDLFENQPMYVDVAFRLTGEGAGSILPVVLIDGVPWADFFPTSDADGASVVEDRVLAPASPGQHVLSVDLDPGNFTHESDETNNVFSLTFTVVQPDLTFFTPAGWPAPVVISRETGTHTNSYPFSDEALYVDVATYDTGPGGASPPIIAVDGVPMADLMFGSSTDGGAHFIYTDRNLPGVGPGVHELAVYLDPGNLYHESDETNNVFTLTFTVTAPDLSFFTPPGWSGPVVISRETGTHTDSDPLADQLYLDFAFTDTGNGGGAAPVVAVDGAPYTDFTSFTTDGERHYFVSDRGIGGYGVGVHELSLYLDPGNLYPESDETNNVFTRSFTVVSLNHPPVITSASTNADSIGAVSENQPVTLAAAFTDPDAADTHTATIDWGDGTAPAAGSVTESGGAGSVAASHAYAAGGAYDITLTVRDNGGLTDTRKLRAYVTGAGVHDGVLQVIGTGCGECIEVNYRPLYNDIKLTADFLPKKRLYAPGSFSVVYVAAGGGSDWVLVAGDVPADAIIDGGSCDDTLTSGRKALIIGGPGADCIEGGKYNDTLVGGTTRYDGDLQSLLGVLNGTKPLTAADVFDDAASDGFTGRKGADTFFGRFTTPGVTDCLYDRRPEDAVVEV